MLPRFDGSCSGCTLPRCGRAHTVRRLRNIVPARLKAFHKSEPEPSNAKKTKVKSEREGLDPVISTLLKAGQQWELTIVEMFLSTYDKKYPERESAVLAMREPRLWIEVIAHRRACRRNCYTFNDRLTQSNAKVA